MSLKKSLFEISKPTLKEGVAHYESIPFSVKLNFKELQFKKDPRHGV